jgi:hypothetical protein
MNSTYEYSNLLALSRRWGALENQLSSIPSSDTYAIQKAKDDSLTAVYFDKDGNQKALHSQYSPLKEAQKRAAEHYTRETRLFFVIGFGLGYYVRELFHLLHDKQKLIVIEPVPSLFRDALKSCAYEDMFKDERFFLVVSDNRMRVSEKVKTVIHSMLPYAEHTISFHISCFYEQWDEYKEYTHQCKKEIIQAISDGTALRQTIYDAINALRLNGLGKKFLGEYKKCLSFLRARVETETRLEKEDVALLATYFLFSHYSYAETFEKGDASAKMTKTDIYKAKSV